MDGLENQELETEELESDNQDLEDLGTEKTETETESDNQEAEKQEDDFEIPDEFKTEDGQPDIKKLIEAHKAEKEKTSAISEKEKENERLKAIVKNFTGTDSVDTAEIKFANTQIQGKYNEIKTNIDKHKTAELSELEAEYQQYVEAKDSGEILDYEFKQIQQRYNAVRNQLNDKYNAEYRQLDNNYQSMNNSLVAEKNKNVIESFMQSEAKTFEIPIIKTMFDELINPMSNDGQLLTSEGLNYYKEGIKTIYDEGDKAGYERGIKEAQLALAKNQQKTKQKGIASAGSGQDKNTVGVKVDDWLNMSDIEIAKRMKAI